MSGDISPYLSLITSEHADKPNFVAWLSAQLQAFADGTAIYGQFTSSYDLDTAVGSQLDVVGQWVGRTRYVAVPLSVYFSLDTPGLGLDEGIWYESFNPLTGLVALPDEQYRIYLKAMVVANQWDGSIPNAYLAWSTLFSATQSTLLLGDGKYLLLADGAKLLLNNYASQIFIQDYDDMSMIIGIFGTAPNAVTLALLTGGYIDLRPEGVRIRGYATPTVNNQPLFGLDVPNELSRALAGLDLGNWALITPPTS